MIKFTILFDNDIHESGLEVLWGFSCLIEVNNQKILFDTGSNGRVLLKNAQKMGISFKDIDILFISHSHWDHIGGIDTIIEENPDIIIIVPNTLSTHLIDDLKKLVKKVIVIDNKFTKLASHLYSTGVIDNIEQSLVLKYKDELYLIIGCGHPGIEKIEKLTHEYLKLPIKYVIGGLHLMHTAPKDIQKTIKNVQTKYITATHCTGDMAIGMFKIKYQENFYNGGVGAVIEFE